MSNETTNAPKMPTNTVRTCNCQYKHSTTGKVCNKPPAYIHAESGKVFCFNHYSQLSLVSSGWVNLQRKDAQAEIDRLKKVHCDLLPLHGALTPATV